MVTGWFRTQQPPTSHHHSFVDLRCSFWPPWRVQWRRSLAEFPQPASSLTRNIRNSACSQRRTKGRSGLGATQATSARDLAGELGAQSPGPAGPPSFSPPPTNPSLFLYNTPAVGGTRSRSWQLAEGNLNWRRRRALSSCWWRAGV